jgi:hypothetical protein
MQLSTLIEDVEVGAFTFAIEAYGGGGPTNVQVA